MRNKRKIPEFQTFPSYRDMKEYGGDIGVYGALKWLYDNGGGSGRPTDITSSSLTVGGSGYNKTIDLSIYSASENYTVGQLVIYNDKIYQCITATTGTWNSNNWKLLGSDDGQPTDITSSSLTIGGSGYNKTIDLSTYNTSENYAIGQLVIYNDRIYQCITATTGTWNSINWKLLSSDGGIPEAPIDGKQYGRQSSNWTEIIGGNSKVNNSYKITFSNSDNDIIPNNLSNSIDEYTYGFLKTSKSSLDLTRVDRSGNIISIDYTNDDIFYSENVFIFSVSDGSQYIFKHKPLSVYKIDYSQTFPMPNILSTKIDIYETDYITNINIGDYVSQITFFDNMTINTNGSIKFSNGMSLNVQNGDITVQNGSVINNIYTTSGGWNTINWETDIKWASLLHTLILGIDHIIPEEIVWEQGLFVTDIIGNIPSICTVHYTPKKFTNVKKIKAGNNITIDPDYGMGEVTINAIGGGGGGSNQSYNINFANFNNDSITGLPLPSPNNYKYGFLKTNKNDLDLVRLDSVGNITSIDYTNGTLFIIQPKYQFNNQQFIRTYQDLAIIVYDTDVTNHFRTIYTENSIYNERDISGISLSEYINSLWFYDVIDISNIDYSVKFDDGTIFNIQNGNITVQYGSNIQNIYTDTSGWNTNDWTQNGNNWNATRKILQFVDHTISDDAILWDYGKTTINITGSFSKNIGNYFYIRETDRIVKKIKAGNNVTISPENGKGEVTINATSGGSGNSNKTFRLSFYNDINTDKPSNPDVNDIGFIKGDSSHQIKLVQYGIDTNWHDIEFNDDTLFIEYNILVYNGTNFVSNNDEKLILCKYVVNDSTANPITYNKQLLFSEIYSNLNRFRMGLENNSWKIDVGNPDVIEIPYANTGSVNLLSDFVIGQDDLPTEFIFPENYIHTPLFRYDQVNDNYIYRVQFDSTLDIRNGTILRVAIEFVGVYSDQNTLTYNIVRLEYYYYDNNDNFVYDSVILFDTQNGTGYITDYTNDYIEWNHDERKLTIINTKIADDNKPIYSGDFEYDGTMNGGHEWYETFVKNNPVLLNPISYDDIGVIKPESDTINIDNGHLEVITNTPVTTTNKIATMADVGRGGDTTKTYVLNFLNVTNTILPDSSQLPHDKQLYGLIENGKPKLDLVKINPDGTHTIIDYTENDIFLKGYNGFPLLDYDLGLNKYISSFDTFSIGTIKENNEISWKVNVWANKNLKDLQINTIIKSIEFSSEQMLLVDLNIKFNNGEAELDITEDYINFIYKTVTYNIWAKLNDFYSDWEIADGIKWDHNTKRLIFNTDTAEKYMLVTNIINSSVTPDLIGSYRGALLSDISVNLLNTNSNINIKNDEYGNYTIDYTGSNYRIAYINDIDSTLPTNPNTNDCVLLRRSTNEPLQLNKYVSGNNWIVIPFSNDTIFIEYNPMVFDSTNGYKQIDDDILTFYKRIKNSSYPPTYNKEILFSDRYSNLNRFRMGLENNSWKIDVEDPDVIEIPYADTGTSIRFPIDIIPGDNLKNIPIKLPPASDLQSNSLPDGSHPMPLPYEVSTLNCPIKIIIEPTIIDEKIGVSCDSNMFVWFDGGNKVCDQFNGKISSISIIYSNNYKDLVNPTVDDYIDSLTTEYFTWDKPTRTLTFIVDNIVESNDISWINTPTTIQPFWFNSSPDSILQMSYGDIGVIKPESDTINVNNGHLEVITNTPATTTNKIATMADVGGGGSESINIYNIEFLNSISDIITGLPLPSSNNYKYGFLKTNKSNMDLTRIDSTGTTLSIDYTIKDLFIINLSYNFRSNKYMKDRNVYGPSLAKIDPTTLSFDNIYINNMKDIYKSGDISGIRSGHYINSIIFYDTINVNNSANFSVELDDETTFNIQNGDITVQKGSNVQNIYTTTSGWNTTDFVFNGYKWISSTKQLFFTSNISVDTELIKWNIGKIVTKSTNIGPSISNIGYCYFQNDFDAPVNEIVAGDNITLSSTGKGTVVINSGENNSGKYIALNYFNKDDSDLPPVNLDIIHTYALVYEMIGSNLSQYQLYLGEPGDSSNDPPKWTQQSYLDDIDIFSFEYYTKVKSQDDSEYVLTDSVGLFYVKNNIEIYWLFKYNIDSSIYRITYTNDTDTTLPQNPNNGEYILYQSPGQKMRLCKYDGTNWNLLPFNKYTTFMEYNPKHYDGLTEYKPINDNILTIYKQNEINSTAHIYNKEIIFSQQLITTSDIPKSYYIKWYNSVSSTGPDDTDGLVVNDYLLCKNNNNKLELWKCVNDAGIWNIVSDFSFNDILYSDINSFSYDQISNTWKKDATNYEIFRFNNQNNYLSKLLSIPKQSPPPIWLYIGTASTQTNTDPPWAITLLNTDIKQKSLGDVYDKTIVGIHPGDQISIYSSYMEGMGVVKSVTGQNPSDSIEVDMYTYKD